MSSQIQPIAVYEPFKAQIVELKKFDAEKVFNYETLSGNKEARSHVYKLRQTRSAVDKARKEAKADSLALGKRIDAEAKEIDDEIETLIERHDSVLREIEDREAARVAKIRAKIDDISSCGGLLHGLGSGALKDNLAILSKMTVDASFEEFADEAKEVLTATVDVVRIAMSDAIIAEADRAELDKLRAEKTAKEAADREAEIIARAEKRAKEEAERLAKSQIDAANKAREDAERQAAAAIKAAERAAEDAIKAAAAKVEKAAAEDAKREANKRNRAAVHKRIVVALVLKDIDKDDAELLVETIASGEIPELKIVY